MKIAAAQLKPLAGAYETNVAKHLRLIDLAAIHGASLVVFPEMSLTGYEPTKAKELLIDAYGSELNVFDTASNASRITICVGAPTAAEAGIRISMVIFRPQQSRALYSKQLLHADELPYFVAGDDDLLLTDDGTLIAPAICYESLQPEHAERAASHGAHIYMASVAKSASGVSKAKTHYPRIAKQHGFTVIMANSIGPCDNFIAVGQSSAWDRQGALLGQLTPVEEGILMVDTNSSTATTHRL